MCKLPGLVVRAHEAVVAWSVTRTQKRFPASPLTRFAVRFVGIRRDIRRTRRALVPAPPGT